MPLTAPTNVMKMVVDYQTHACGSGINQFVQLWTELNQRPLCYALIDCVCGQIKR